MTRILVIKHGALGDFVLAMGPFAAIRRHHRGAAITLLTTAPFGELAEASGYFDAVWIDTRPKLTQPFEILKLARRLNNAGFERVYDLQTSTRSDGYFRLMGPLFGGVRPEWSGVAGGCSHPHVNPNRAILHTIERQKDQLAGAGIMDVPGADLGWAVADISRFGLTDDAAPGAAPPYVLIAPGGARHRPRKRWPMERFAALAAKLAARGVTPVVLGAEAEREVADAVCDLCAGARNLCAMTSFIDIIALARDAAGAVGNDTGPMHLIAATGCPSVVLFSGESDPALCAPRGPVDGESADEASLDRASVTVLRRESLADLALGEVDAALSLR
jgi:ADP-heptose:LPS heptosyltransferase